MSTLAGLFVLMRTGVLAVALVVFALLRIHGLAVQLRVLLRKLMLLLARCLRLLFLLLQLRDPRLFLHVHAGRFLRGSSAVLWRWCMYMRGGLHQMRGLVLLRLLPVHGGMWRGCGWRALTEPLPWMGDGLVSLAGSMFGHIDDAF
ncbi:hypothetical protein [Xanthomonas sp. MUS 060]|uniref:hypothetical protein n=1 Tax=Xanthomonas sp. MUS 060 TaxID=1588031 RepID=UPI0005F2BCA4|nr:hypothetical protein [Xanthomonas sp. MUS 060]